jgi:hypothetical protein
MWIATRPYVLALAGAIVLALAGCGGTDALGPGPVSPGGTTDRLPAKSVSSGDLRWRDISGYLYADAFRAAFGYTNPESYVRVVWDDTARTLSGTLTAVRLKPNFAYQMKLVGRSTIGNARRPASPTSDPMGWASWQLGNNGRWWCLTDAWNVSDSELSSHLKRRHQVIGYLLFDFLITDAQGNATKPFALKSTYHVLWRSDQRARGANDSAIVPHDLYRGAWGYGLTDPPALEGTTGVYAEWEPNRPLPGQVKLPAGPYPILLNITEESFHDNLGNTVPYGGFWAQVLEGQITFTDNDGTYQLAQASRP